MNECEQFKYFVTFVVAVVIIKLNLFMADTRNKTVWVLSLISHICLNIKPINQLTDACHFKL